MLHISGNIESIEVLWTLVAVVGLFLAAWNFSAAQSSIGYMKKLGVVDARLIIARVSRTTELVRFLIQSIELILGVIAMTLPPASTSELPLRLRLSAFVIRWGLVACATLTLIQSFNSWRLRRYFLADRHGNVQREVS